ncbi:MAG: zf-HC2 domain-containing protein [Gemmataceae bacterium]|nr:zf-HC2 domain-containing protein [Gemmataceae bacterium]
MMTCKEIAELLLDYLDGNLPKEYCDIICQHINLCGPCLHYVESYQLTMKICRELPRAPMPHALVERLQVAWKEIQEMESREEQH